MLLRVAFVVLLVCNGLVLAWALGYLGGNAQGEPRRLEQQVAAEQVRVVAVGERPRPPASGRGVANGKEDKQESGSRPAGEQVCRQWRDLADADAGQLERMLAERFADFKVGRLTNSEVIGYWVFIPPLANRDEAKRKVAEIEQLGDQEHFIVQPAGPNQFAISLGTYRTEAAANTRLEALRAKGVKSARVGERRGKALHTVEARGPLEQAAALGEAVNGLLPKTGSAECSVDAGAAR